MITVEQLSEGFATIRSDADEPESGRRARYLRREMAATG